MITSICRGVRRARDEEGSLLMAVMIIMIVVTLVTAVAFQVIGNQTIVGARQSTSEAVARADAGISDALFRLDQGGATAGYDSTAGTWSTYCVGATGCAASSLPAVPNVSYKVVPNNSSNPSAWTVYSKATSGSQTGAVIETVSRTSMYPFALFTNNSLTLNGSTNIHWGTYSSSSSVADPSQNVGIGSDRYLSCNGNLASNVFPSYYQANGSTTGSQCGTSTTTDYNYPIPTAPSSYSACPNNGNLGSGATPTAWPSLGAAGTTTTYLCTVPVTITGNLTILGTVNLYIILTPPAPSGDSYALGLAGGSYSNDQYDYCLNVLGKSDGYCTAQYGKPVATNFQVFTNSTLNVGDTNGHGIWFGGIINAPQASMTENGCKGVFWGAIILNNFTCNGGSAGFSLTYDQALSQDYGPVVINGYRQVPPGTFTIP